MATGHFSSSLAWRSIYAVVIGCAILLALPALWRNAANVVVKARVPLTQAETITAPRDYCALLVTNVPPEIWSEHSSLPVSLASGQAESSVLVSFFAGWQSWCSGVSADAITRWTPFGTPIGTLFNRYGAQALVRADSQAAVGWLELAVALQPHNAAVVRSLGDAYMRANAPATALKMYHQSFELAPTQAGTIAGAAIAESMMAQFGMAEQDIQKAIQLDPQNSLYWQIYGGLLLNYEGNAEAAETWLERVVTAEPQNSTTFLTLAIALLRQGKTAQAQAAIDSALGTASGSPQKVNELTTYAGALVQANHMPDAVKYYNDALALDPNNLDTRAALATLYAQLDQCDRARTIVANTIFGTHLSTAQAHDLVRCVPAVH